MATAEECQQAFERLIGRLSELDPGDRDPFFSGRTFSCQVPDLNVTYLTRFGPSGADPVHLAAPGDPKADVRLTATDPKDPCFTIAFSPSGHICAVGSQCGTITIFATSRIHPDMDHEDAVIDVLQSSRPFTPSTLHAAIVPGAVRSMAFCPAPWDLLAWAEDKGRFCITDLRDGFRTRQTVEIDSERLNACSQAELLDVTHDPLTESDTVEPEAAFAARYHAILQARDPLAEIHRAASSR